MQVLSRVLSCATDPLRSIASNPCESIRQFDANYRSGIVWTEQAAERDQTQKVMCKTACKTSDRGKAADARQTLAPQAGAGSGNRTRAFSLGS